MLKAFVETLVGLKKNETYVLDGNNYSDNPLHLIKEDFDRPKISNVTTLGSIVTLIQSEIENASKLPSLEGQPLKLFVRVKGYKSVEVFTSYMKDMSRIGLYTAEADTVELIFDRFMGYEEAQVALRSKFTPTDDSTYLLELLASVKDEDSVENLDNGTSQSVIVKKGITMAQKAVIKPRLKLKPFRTFLEVEQPESEFVLRLKEGGEVGLYEADGGMWKLDAKKTIANYLDDHLFDLINQGKVVVMI